MSTVPSIVLVEDNPDDVALTLRALRKTDVASRVTVLRDGAEAIDHLLGDLPAARLPDLVLLDIKLPRLDGLEVLRRLRADERTRLLPVVVLTTSQEQQDILTSYRLGANSYIRKPVDFSKFTEAVRALGMYWLTLNEAAQA
jgi:two-component system response regulator